MKPLLLNPDGSIPNGLTIDIIKEYGLTPVLPAPVPEPSPGFYMVEDEPVEILGVFFQRWKEVPLDQSKGDPEPEAFPVDPLIEAIQTLTPEQREALLKALS